MKICLICVEIFAWGKYGGFGRSTRMLGRELIKRGIEVTAIVPRRPGQKPVEMLDGVRVLGFEPRWPFSVIDLIREANADIYHSQEPSFTTYLAQKVMPHRKHIVTFRDTRNLRDWWIFFSHPTFSSFRVLLNYIFEDNVFVARSVQRANGCFVAAHFLASKAQRKYRLRHFPTFLPSPVFLQSQIAKSKKPLVCFIGRLDRIKRPWIFFDLALKFPNVDFVAVGAGHNMALEKHLYRTYGDLQNLRLYGFIDQFHSNELFDILAKSWVLVNMSPHESLPTSFIEAVGHECAILSEMNPDDFAANFGYHVQDGDYEKGLRYLLMDDCWLNRGKLGAEYVRQTFSITNSIDQHIEIYQKLIYQAG